MPEESLLPPLPIETRVFTFYSFKGGVGRSMALVNSAAQLARAGRRVLVIDLDLEAPGVSYLAKQKKVSSKSGGFIDVIYDFLKSGERSPLGNPTNNDPFGDYTVAVDIGETSQTPGGGVITIMPAGDLSNVREYQKRLRFLELSRMYREGVGAPLLTHFKKRLCRLGGDNHFDYVLVDARTGFSAESTIAVRDLADHLVVIMGLNHQNIEGTCGFLRALHSESKRPESLTIVISPIPLGEDELASNRIEIARGELATTWPDLRKKGSIGTFNIPYHPRLALDESPHQARLTNQPLTQAYRRIYEHLRNLASDSLWHYARRAGALLDAGSAAEALPYVARLITEGYPGNYEFARRALNYAADAKTQASYVEILRPVVASSLEIAESVASLLKTKGAIDDADKMITTFVENNPDDILGWLKKGVLLEDTPRLEEATAAFKKAVQVAPKNTWVWNRYACHLWERRHLFSEASVAFEQWARLHPKIPAEFGNFAEFCIATARYEEALNAMERAWNERRKDEWVGHLLFCAAVFSRLIGDSESERLQLRRIKWGLNVGLRDVGATFAGLLETISRSLDPEHLKFYTTLSLVLTGREQVAKLAAFPLWLSFRRGISLSGPLFRATPNIVELNQEQLIQTKELLPHSGTS